MRNKKTYTLWDIEQQQQQQQQQQRQSTSHETRSAMAAVDTPVPTDSEYELLQPGFKPLLPQLQGKDASMITVLPSAKAGAKGGEEREISDPPPALGRSHPPGFYGCAGEPPRTDLSRQIPETRPYTDQDSYYDWDRRAWTPIYSEGCLGGYFTQNQSTAHGHNDNNNNNNNQQPCDSGTMPSIASQPKPLPSHAAKAAAPLRPIPENSV